MSCSEEIQTSQEIQCDILLTVQPTVHIFIENKDLVDDLILLKIYLCAK